MSRLRIQEHLIGFCSEIIGFLLLRLRRKRISFIHRQYLSFDCCELLFCVGIEA